MRIGFVIALAITLGLALGASAMVVEFGYQDPHPTLETYAVPLDVKGPPPHVVVKQPKHEFGEMDNAAVGRHTFVIENTGPGTLTLGEGQKTCACTVASVSRHEVPAGETADVVVEWKPLHIFGEFTRTVSFPTNDPEQRLLGLTVHGQVLMAWQLMPGVVIFPSMLVKESRDMTVDLLVYQGEKCEIVGHEWNDKKTADHFSLRYEPLAAEELAKLRPTPKSGQRLTIGLKAGLPLGRWTQDLALTTTLNNKAPITINLNGDIAPDISLYGAQYTYQTGTFQVGTVARGTEARRQLWLQVRGPHCRDTKFTVKKVVPADLQVSIGDLKSDDGESMVRMPIQILVPATARPVKLLGSKPDEMGEIVIATTHPEEKELRLHVQLAIVEPSKSK